MVNLTCFVLGHKTIKKTRDPQWGEEFQFMLEEPPVNEKIHVQVMSKRTSFGFRSKVCIKIMNHI